MDGGTQVEANRPRLVRRGGRTWGTRLTSLGTHCRVLETFSATSV